MTKIRVSAILGCRHCGMFTGWVSKRFDPLISNGPRSINTICSVCHGRLRHKIGMRDKDRQYTHCYTAGRGAHNRSISVTKYIPWNNPSTCKSEASRKNRQLLQNREKRHKKFDTRDRRFEFTKASELK